MQTHTVHGKRGNMTWTITRGGRGVPRWIGYVLIGAGLLFALALARYQVRLALFGTAATGEVVAFDRLHKRVAPRVRFTSADGRVAEFHGTSLRGTKLAVGERVPILYIDSTPVFGEIATFRRFWLGLIVGSVLTISLITGGLFLLRRRHKHV
jgi:hypothetical protein